MDQLAGWDGPICMREGLYRYSKAISWIRLYIEVDDSELRGGMTGSGEDFEIAMEDGLWRRYQTAPAYSPDGNLVLILRDYTTLETVVQRIGDGEIIAEEISSIEDLATYLNKCYLMKCVAEPE